MRAIGFRAEKDTIHWAVVEGTVEDFKLVADDKYSAPRTYGEAESLAWFRDRVGTTIVEYRPDAAGVRLSETFLQHKPKPNVLSSMFARARIEGVILETCQSHAITVLPAQLVTISAKLESPRAKAYLESGEFLAASIFQRSRPTEKTRFLLQLRH